MYNCLANARLLSSEYCDSLTADSRRVKPDVISDLDFFTIRALANLGVYTSTHRSNLPALKVQILSRKKQPLRHILESW